MEQKLFGTQGDRSGDLWHAKAKPYHCTIEAATIEVAIIFNLEFHRLLIVLMILFFKRRSRGCKKCIFLNIFSVDSRFLFIRGLVIPYRLAATCQKSARIEFGIELISITVGCKFYFNREFG